MKKQIKRKIYLLSKRQMKPIEVVQYETGVQLVFEVQDIELDTSATATLFVRKPSGKFVFQENDISLTGNTVVIDLHNQALTEYGKPFFQIKFKKDEEVISTYSGMLTVEKSLDDSGAEESKTVIAAFDTFTDEQIARIEEATRSQIDLMKAEVEAKGEAVLATIPDEYTEMYNKVNTLFNSVANAIKGTVSGSVVRVDDVSPLEHNVGVKVRSKNLLPYPYHTTEISKNGGVFTVQSDGGIVASGTPTDYSHITVYSGEALCKSGVVTASISGSFENISCDFILKDSNSNIVETCGFTPPYQYSGTVNLDDYPTVTSWSLAVKRAVNGKEMSGVVYPQIEFGETATEYTPYIDPTTVTVRRCGKNILPLNYLDGLERIHNGITFTVQGDGGIKAVGTATEYAYFKLMNTDISKAPYVATDCLFDNNNKLTFIPVQSGVTVNKVFYPQIEIGTVATDYEKPQEQVTYTPTVDGVCDITSVSPTMTLLTDTEGVTIECEYNKDTGKVIDNLIKAVVALGGVV